MLLAQRTYEKLTKQDTINITGGGEKNSDELRYPSLCFRRLHYDVRLR